MSGCNFPFLRNRLPRFYPPTYGGRIRSLNNYPLIPHLHRRHAAIRHLLHSRKTARTRNSRMCHRQNRRPTLSSNLVRMPCRPRQQTVLNF